MDSIISSNTGLVHTIVALLAMVFGTSVLILKKGTALHKKMGYAYVLSMVIMLVTSFMLFNLFGEWGVFHYMAVVSMLTISAGMIPAWFRKSFKNWRELHFTFMFWSVIGLYCAFFAEALTRIPGTGFFKMVGLASGVVVGLGFLIINKKNKAWKGY